MNITRQSINMSILCSQCNKTFVNKYSLASHKSRYHYKVKNASDDDYPKNNWDKSSIYSDNTSQGKNIASARSGSDDGDVHDDPDSDEHDDVNKKDALASSESEDDKLHESDDSVSSNSGNIYLNRKKDALDSDSDSESDEESDGNLRKRKSLKLHLSSKKMRDRSTKSDVTELLSSIENMLHEHTSRTDPFNLFQSFELKWNVFSNLRDTVFGSLEAMQEALTDDEHLLVQAVLETASLDETSRLLNENTDLILSILSHVKVWADNSPR